MLSIILEFLPLVGYSNQLYKSYFQEILIIRLEILKKIGILSFFKRQMVLKKHLK